MAVEANIIHLIWICTSAANAQQGSPSSAGGFKCFECLITFYGGTLDATNRPEWVSMKCACCTVMLVYLRTCFWITYTSLTKKMFGLC